MDGHGEASHRARLGRAGWAWALFQGGRDPFVILVTIYVFAPYFVAHVVGDAVRGQTLVASAAKYAGWVVMLTAPLLGAAVDRMGPRKPWLAAVVVLMAPLIAALWFVRPDGHGIGVGGTVVMLAAIAVLFAYSETLHNSLLVPAAGMAKAGTASGLALALGNFVSVALLVGVLWAFVLPGKIGGGLVATAPLFGLDAALHEPDRIVGPLTAMTLVLGALPLFVTVPDVRATGTGFVAAIRAGAADLRALAVEARGHANALVYLGAVLLFTDALTGILVFSGVYAAGALGWGTLELVAYGIILSVFAVAGGFLAGWLDGRVGPKRALQIELVGVIVSQILALGQTRTSLFFTAYDRTAHAPLWGGPMFTTAPDVALLACGFLGAVTVTAAYASRRTMLTRVVPPAKIGVFFGLFVIAGTATAWLAPLLVELATRWSGSQRIGLLPIEGLALAGLIVLGFVRGGGKPV